MPASRVFLYVYNTKKYALNVWIHTHTHYSGRDKKRFLLCDTFSGDRTKKATRSVFELCTKSKSTVYAPLQKRRNVVFVVSRTSYVSASNELRRVILCRINPGDVKLDRANTGGSRDVRSHYYDDDILMVRVNVAVWTVWWAYCFITVAVCVSSNSFAGNR